MLCYVTRPDAVLMEVEVEAKANGEDCLNQVRMKAKRGPHWSSKAEGPRGGARRWGAPPARGRAELRRRRRGWGSGERGAGQSTPGTRLLPSPPRGRGA